MQEFGMDMIVDIYDQQGDWSIYQSSVDLFINQSVTENNYPILLLSIPDPSGPK